MRRAVLVMLLLALAVPSVADAARRHVPRGWLGVVVDGPLLDPAYAGGAGEWDRLAGSGAESVRAAFYWRLIQPTGPADADFTYTDTIVLAAAQRRLPVLPTVQATPDWAALHPGDPASPPRAPADFARLLTALVARYGPHGSFWAEHPEVARRPIRAWQIWNEPNLTRYWNVPRWARSYAALVRAADRALKRADRHSKTVLAGLPNESWEALEDIYRAHARGHFDVVALHPYTGKPKNVVRIVKIVRRLMKRRGDRRVPIWLTELSWPAARGKTITHGDFETTDSGQARRLSRVLPKLAKQRRKLRIGRVYWYTWLSVEGFSGSAFDYSGLRRMRGGQVHDARALATFRRLARRLQGCAKRPGDARRCA
ncbi:MAG TPA: hypothetical protein VFG79_14295 [Solirubrobacter sp.]|nr:hypothetical protein [Solirubrobacter sp.]